MNSDILKKALLRGILTGLIIALVILGIRTLIGGNNFIDNLKSVYGILTIICFPVAAVLYFYVNLKNKEK